MERFFFKNESTLRAQVTNNCDHNTKNQGERPASKKEYNDSMSFIFLLLVVS
jgi:hypothetical protein